MNQIASTILGLRLLLVTTKLVTRYLQDIVGSPVQERNMLWGELHTTFSHMATVDGALP